MADQRGVAPEGYEALLGDLKERIRRAQIKAALAVNREVIQLYWQVGRAILERQEAYGWGAQVIARLSADLHQAFPEMKGFSPRNLQYMRTFAGAYPDPEIAQQLLRDLPWGHLTHLQKPPRKPTPSGVRMNGVAPASGPSALRCTLCRRLRR